MPKLRVGLAKHAAEAVTALVAVVTYLSVLPNDFADDGVPIVARNPLVQAPGQWLTIWTTDYWHMAADATPNRDLLYRPLALSTYRLVRVLFGTSPAPQHAVNILLHALVAVLVVRLTRLVVPGGNEPARMTPRAPTGDAAAWLAGLLFAVLPIHSEVIANVVGRADLLAATGMLGALIVFASLGAGEAACASPLRLVLLAALVLVALSAKESGVAVLALLPLWHVLAGRRAPWPWILAVGIPAVIYFTLRYLALDGNLFQKPALTKTVNMLVDAPAWQRAAGAIQLWGLYWLKTFWPDVLSVNYSINALRPATNAFHPHVLLGAAAAIVLGAVAVRAARRGRRGLLFAAIALPLVYLPTANLLVLIQVSFAERIWYLPSVFACVLTGWAVSPLLARRLGWPVAVLCLAAMGVRTLVRGTEWRNNLTVYAAAYRDMPEAIGALRLFGNELVAAGQYERGIELLHRALEIDLGFTDAQRSLGVAYLLAGDAEGAVRHLQTADMQIPGHPPTQAALREARVQLGIETAQDIQRLKDFVHGDEPAAPDATHVASEIALLRALRDTGRLEEALQRIERGRDHFDQSADWHHERAITLVTANKLNDAIAAYERSLELDPAVPSRLVEQAMLRLERRLGDDLQRAAALADEALRLAPDMPEALVCRAELGALRGDFAGAARDYARAIGRLDVNDPRRRVWEQRAKTLGG